MTALIKNSQASGVEAYEDMFKEITKKLYGEETSQSLHGPVAHITPDVERSITNLFSDRNVSSGEFDHGSGIDSSGTLKTDDHLAAFGLAALMQNGFATSNSLLSNHTYKTNPSDSSTVNNVNNSSGNTNANTVHNSSNESIQEKCASLQHTNDLNAWTSKVDAYQHTSKYCKSKKSDGPNHEMNPNQSSNTNDDQSGQQKRFNCSNCPYSTDRRDLFTRHENIHKEDKPFYCYICLKQFNRADHVKKHFLRIHRGLVYDIGRTKRSVAQAKSKKLNTSGTMPCISNNTQQTNLNAPISYHDGLQNQHQQQIEPQTVSIDQTNQHLGNTFNTTFGTVTTPPTIKDEKLPKKNDKRFLCCYCSWSGNDNWGLKRHLNTHLKPYLCVLCDYKAARSERLTTHVLKVHNKKVCTKCNYFAGNQSEYDIHVAETHANDTRTQRTNQTDLRSTSKNASRNNDFNAANSFCSVENSSSDQGFGSNWRSMLSGTGINTPNVVKTNGSNNLNQKRGAERLFQYFEADDSDPEDYARQLQMAAISRNTASVAQDFHNAGGEKMNEIMYAKYQNFGIMMTEANMQNVDIKLLALVQWKTKDYNEIAEENICQENENSHDDATVTMSISSPAKKNQHYKAEIEWKNVSNGNLTFDFIRMI